MKEQYIYDEKNARFSHESPSKSSRVRKIVRFALVAVVMTVVYYVLFSLLFSTGAERQLKQENKALEALLPELEEKERLISDVISLLEVRDNRIYEEIFKTSAPKMDMMDHLNVLEGLDTIPDKHLVGATKEKLDRLISRSLSVEDNFRQIAGLVSEEGFQSPPMTLPMKGVSFAQVGASIGEKVNPFYKVVLMHEGVDIISASGEPVYAAQDGYVSDVTFSRKGLGNVVTIKHKNGYVTRYAHLGDVTASSGTNVKRGQKIGTIGAASNSSYAPHLHYEVRRDTLLLDPINHFFLSVTPKEYVNMMIMSSLTGQSMD